MDNKRKESNDLTQRCMDKLAQFIKSFVKRKGMTNVPTEFDFKGLDEAHATMVFNIWLSLDYITPYGKRFIEHFLEESKDLSGEEREILKELNKSFISIYRVVNIKNDYLIVKDLINNEEHILLVDEENEVKEGYVFVGRIVNILGHLEFTGITTYFDPTAEKIMVDTVNRYYNAAIANNSHITMKDYLKNFSNLIYEFLDTIIEIYSEEEDIHLQIKEQLDKFSVYLHINERLKKNTIERHTNKLYELYWYYLKDIEKTLYDINGDILDNFITSGIFDGFMTSKSDISGYITAIKKFGKYLKESDIINEKAYEDIVKMAKNKDRYIRQFEEYEKNGFDDIDDSDHWLSDDFLDYMDILDEEDTAVIDEELAQIIEKYNYNKINEFISDYKKYIDYLSDNDVKATDTNKYIGRKHLMELNEIISNSINIDKSINQKNIPILHLFYKISIDNGILTIDDKDKIKVEEKIEEYNELDDNKKIAVFINYIWNKANWRDFADDNMGVNDEEYELRNEFIKILSKLKSGKYYNFRDVQNTYKEEDISRFPIDQKNNLTYRYPMAVSHVFNTKIIRYFSYIGLLDIQYRKAKDNYELMYGDDIHKIQISKFGREVFKYLKKI